MKKKSSKIDKKKTVRFDDDDDNDDGASSASPSPIPKGRDRRDTKRANPAATGGLEKATGSAKAKLTQSPTNGDAFHGLFFTVKGFVTKIMDMSPQEIAANIELLEPLIRPYGCGPVAPANWIVLRTYMKIVEWRDEIRMDESGLTIGDRGFKYSYQDCLRQIARYMAAAAAVREAADKAKWKGVETNNEKEKGLFLGPLRSPEFAIRHAFRFFLDRYWHRYLLPFGCFAIEKPSVQGAGWDDWRNHQVAAKNNSGNLMNPCSVTAADILYLCNTTGYLDRFVYITGIILWAKKKGVNLLRHRSPAPRDAGSATFDEFMTMEKHVHLFGSLCLHKKVLETNNSYVGGNWTESIKILDILLYESYARFGLHPNSLNRDLDNMYVDARVGSLTGMQTFFPNAARLSTDKKTTA